MADDTTGGNEGGADGGQEGGADGAKFSQADLDRIVADRITRERAKYADYGDLKRFKQSAMTDQERAVAEAEQRGAQTATQKAGQRLVRAEFRAAATGRVEKDVLDAYLEDVDPAKFLGADGEPDTKAIEARINRLGGGQRGTDFDGGTRTSGQATDMNALIRRSAGYS